MTINTWTMRSVTVVLAGLALAAAGCRNQAEAMKAEAAKAALVLAMDGVTEYAIVTAAAPRIAEQTAAKELAEYLKKVTGAEFKTVAESATEPPPAKAIYVGWTRFAASKGIDCAKLGQEESVIKTVGDSLVITGGQPRGTLYGVYDFLETELGVHWLDRDTEVVPKRPTLALSAIDRSTKPVFGMRFIWTAKPLGPPGEKERTKEETYRARNRQNSWFAGKLPRGGADNLGAPGGPGYHCHNFGAYLPADKYFAEHPEYYALDKDGKTRLPTGIADHAKDPRWQSKGSLCLTHPEARKLVLAKLLETIAADRAKCNTPDQPPPEIYDVSQPDCAVVCHCPDCRALAEREGSESGPLIDFINELADGVRAQYPEVKVQTFAYEWGMIPPRTLRPRENVVIRWCDWMPCHALTQPYPEPWFPLTAPVNAARAENLRRWAAITPGGIHFWDYGEPYAWAGFPFTLAPVLAEDLRLFADNRVIGLFLSSEESLPWEVNFQKFQPPRPDKYNAIGQFSALYNWLAMQLMVNPRQPVEPLLATFFSGYYGPAAPAMRALYDKLVAAQRTLPTYASLTKSQENRRYTIDNDPVMLKIDYVTAAFFAEVDALLEKAEAACSPGSLELLYVQYERLRSDSSLLANWGKLQTKLAPGTAMPFDREAVIARIETRAKPVMTGLGYPEKCLTEKCGTYWQKPLAKYIEEWRAGGKLPKQEAPLAAKEKKTAACVALKAAPALDGKVEGDQAWQGVAATDGKFFVFGKGGEISPRKTSFRTGWSAGALHIAVECDEPEMGKITAAQSDNGNLWEEDSLEMFIALPKADVAYFQFIASAKGSRMNTLAGVKTDLSDREVRTFQGEKSWSAEIRIPFKTLGAAAPKKGDVWSFNPCRNIRTIYPAISASWAQMDEGFHEPQNFGKLVFEGIWNAAQ